MQSCDAYLPFGTSQCDPAAAILKSDSIPSGGIEMKQFTRRQKFGWGLMVLLSTSIVIVALLQYVGANPDNFFPDQRATYIANYAGLMTHIIGGAIALFLGPFLFLPIMRQKKWLPWHRWLGRFYMLGVVISSLAGYYMATTAHGGLPSTIGLAGLATAWLTTVGFAYTRIRNKEVQAHQRWMIRNYALTFSAVSLRLYLGIGAALIATTNIEATFTDVYITSTWLSWVGNLLFAEWLINRRSSRKHKQRTALAAAD